MSRLTNQNIRNIKRIFEEKTYTDLNSSHRASRRPGFRRSILIAAALALCCLLAGYTLPGFSPLDDDDLTLSGVYEGQGIVSVYVENRSNKELKFQEQAKLVCWDTSTEITQNGKPIEFENITFPAHSSGTMTVNLSEAFDIAALEADSRNTRYYLLLTNQDFLFGHDWMCSFSLGEAVLDTNSEPIEHTIPQHTVESLIAEDIEAELRFYFEDSYTGHIMGENEQNGLYIQKVTELLSQFDGNVAVPVDPMLLVERTADGVVFDDTYPAERQYELAGLNYHSVDFYGRIVAGCNSPTGLEYALVLKALVSSQKGEVGGGVYLPLIYMFTYEVSSTLGEDAYAFIYGQLIPFEEMEQYKVYEDRQYVVYEVTDLFYTDLDAYIDDFLSTPQNLYCDENVRERIHNIYEYYKNHDNLTFYYNLPE